MPMLTEGGDVRNTIFMILLQCDVMYNSSNTWHVLTTDSYLHETVQQTAPYIVKSFKEACTFGLSKNAPQQGYNFRHIYNPCLLK